MKKILLATTLVMACGLSTTFAQSKFTVANGATTAVTFLGGPNDGQKVNSVGADKYWAQLYVGADAGSLAPIATAINAIGVNATVANGLFNLGTVTIQGLDAGNTVYLQVRGWLGLKESGGYDSASIRGNNSPVPFTSKINPPVVPFGAQPGGAPSLTGFQIVVPEPGSMMLAGLGLSGLLFLRRRK